MQKHPSFQTISFIGDVCIVFDRKHQRSNEHRELSLLAYLSQLQSPDPGPVRPLHSLTPYQVYEKDSCTVDRGPSFLLLPHKIVTRI